MKVGQKQRAWAQPGLIFAGMASLDLRTHLLLVFCLFWAEDLSLTDHYFNSRLQCAWCKNQTKGKIKVQLDHVDFVSAMLSIFDVLMSLSFLISGAIQVIWTLLSMEMIVRKKKQICVWHPKSAWKNLPNTCTYWAESAERSFSSRFSNDHASLLA